MRGSKRENREGGIQREIGGGGGGAGRGERVIMQKGDKHAVA